MTAITAHAQSNQPLLLNIGDPAPPLRVREWIKGTPVQGFEKNTVYVVEFWATWCNPCIVAMPHLSAMAAEYKDKVTIIGIDIYEEKTTSLEKIKAFIDSMGRRMDYHVATEDSNFMVSGWLEASGERVNGIPRTFVVNANGRIAWIGHPEKLAEILPKIVNNDWDIKAALTKRNLNRLLKEMDDSAGYKLMAYNGNAEKPGDPGKPDSALLLINEMVRNEPRLKYTPEIAYYTFSSLLKTNPHKGYEYGKEMLLASSYEDPDYYAIILPIEWYSDKLKLSAEIYELGIEAYRAYFDHHPDVVVRPNIYHIIAE
jgi:thiol-disulfide isomerase/thioredoxin